jgi:hypothetical protein
MADLKNTIAHIFEHKQHLAGVNEATTQQYVVLPILRALGWDDTNLASMEILPEYTVENGNVDYALKTGQTPELFIECKKWGEPLERHKDQIVNYAFKAGAAIIVGLTNGKIWHLYFSWVEGVPVSERIFCKIDIEDRENAVSDLEKYLLKANVISGEAELNAKIALKEKEKIDTSKPSPIDSKMDDVSDIDDNQSVTKQPVVPSQFSAEEKKPSISERYVADPTETDRNDVAVKVVELRINASGSKRLSWRRIREKLGLRNDEFHRVIRRSEGYRVAVINRIKSLRAQEGGWDYSGKLDVLTGIDVTEEELS